MTIFFLNLFALYAVLASGNFELTAQHEDAFLVDQKTWSMRVMVCKKGSYPNLVSILDYRYGDRKENEAAIDGSNCAMYVEGEWGSESECWDSKDAVETKYVRPLFDLGGRYYIISNCVKRYTMPKRTNI